LFKFNPSGLYKVVDRPKQQFVLNLKKEEEINCNYLIFQRESSFVYFCLKKEINNNCEKKFFFAVNYFGKENLFAETFGCNQ